MTDPIQRLALELGRLPGIGERSAARLAYYIVKASRGAGDRSLAHDLARALTETVDRVGLCEECQGLATSARCSLCSDSRRDRSALCVVESVADQRALEAAQAFRGLYHVLHGALSPLEGVGPDELRMDELVRRLDAGGVRELILATSSTVDGDATALYVARLAKTRGIRVTRLASGIPLGGELEYIDQATLGRAVHERREF